MAKANLSKRDVADELEWLLHEYESHMRSHKMKTQKGLFETVVTVAAEVAEDLAKLKLGKLAKLPFELSTRKIELLEVSLQGLRRQHIVSLVKQLAGVPLPRCLAGLAKKLRNCMVIPFSDNRLMQQNFPRDSGTY
jgi:hypothetical protein